MRAPDTPTRPIAPTVLNLLAGALVLAAPVGLDAQLVDAPAVAGRWQGTLDAGPQGEIPMIFEITVGEDGSLTSTLDVPTQGANDMPTGETTLAGDTLTITVPAIQGAFSGVATPDGTFRGTWSQGPASLPLELRPAAGGPVLERPQHPEPPFPYVVEEVTYPHPDGDFDLAGTFTRPEGEAPVPAVILVSGSGPQDRDETIFGHKPFLVIADHLTRAGIAVLRFDDRGVGGSGGDRSEATSADFATDVAAGVAWLEGRDDVAEIGIVGHSEGGLIAPMVAAEDDRVDFIVLLAGTGVPGSEILPEQQQRIATASGVPADRVEWNHALVEETVATVLRVAPEERLDSLVAVVGEAVRSLSPEERAEVGIPEDGVDAWVEGQARTMDNAWMAWFLANDPRDWLSRVEVPVLAMSGSLDLQVPPDQNLPEIEAALAEGGNERVTVIELPGLNHLFQTTESGAPAEYGSLTETFAPAALEALTGWILEVTGTAPAGGDL